MSAPVRTHLVVGEFDQVAAMMATARESGRLVRVLSAVELPEGLVEVIAELRAPEPVRSRWWPWLRVAGWLAALAVIAGVVWLLVWAVMALAAVVMAALAWVQAHLAGIVFAAIGVALVLAWACSGSSCSGLHCGGCRR
jgi:hypothetical protein